MDVKVTVLDGNQVHFNKKKYPPGKSFVCDMDEALRLENRDVVIIDDGDLQDDDPGLPGTKEELIVTVIHCLDPDQSNKSDWTRSKIPQASALSEILGESVSAAERDVAYGIYLESQSGDDK